MISMVKRIRTSRLSIKKSLSSGSGVVRLCFYFRVFGLGPDSMSGLRGEELILSHGKGLKPEILIHASMKSLNTGGKQVLLELD